jgi:hypothetical protein
MQGAAKKLRMWIEKSIYEGCIKYFDSQYPNMCSQLLKLIDLISSGTGPLTDEECEIIKEVFKALYNKGRLVLEKWQYIIQESGGESIGSLIKVFAKYTELMQIVESIRKGSYNSCPNEKHSILLAAERIPERLYELVRKYYTIIQKYEDKKRFALFSV